MNGAAQVVPRILGVLGGSTGGSAESSSAIVYRCFGAVSFEEVHRRTQILAERRSRRSATRPVSTATGGRIAPLKNGRMLDDELTYTNRHTIAQFLADFHTLFFYPPILT
jgi:hypothetical protein